MFLAAYFSISSLYDRLFCDYQYNKNKKANFSFIIVGQNYFITDSLIYFSFLTHYC